MLELFTDAEDIDHHSSVIAKKIASKANGIFLYANLVLQSLDRTGLKLGSDFMSSLPKDLNGIYQQRFERMFEGIAERWVYY